MSLLVLPGDVLSQLRVRSTATHTWGGGEGERDEQREGGR